TPWGHLSTTFTARSSTGQMARRCYRRPSRRRDPIHPTAKDVRCTLSKRVEDRKHRTVEQVIDIDGQVEGRDLRPQTRQQAPVGGGRGHWRPKRALRVWKTVSTTWRRLATPRAAPCGW